MRIELLLIIQYSTLLISSNQVGQVFINKICGKNKTECSNQIKILKNLDQNKAILCKFAINLFIELL